MFSALNFEGMFEVGATITFLGNKDLYYFSYPCSVFNELQKLISVFNNIQGTKTRKEENECHNKSNASSLPQANSVQS